MDSEIKINILELASELADKKLREDWDYNSDIPIDEHDQEDDAIYYSEEAQDIFNDLYDEYYNIIKECEV